MRLALVTLSIAAFPLLLGCNSDRPNDAAPPAELSQEERDALVAEAGAPLFQGMGHHHHPITTSHPGAQRYFDQGMTIAFAFNHAESIRSFKAAQRLDDDCAACFWGEALATGPNINVTSNGKAVMSDADRHAANEALQAAIARKNS